MISDPYIKEQSDMNERIAEKRFRRMHMKPTRLDVQGPRKRPEFLVSDGAGPVVICEVKTIFSAAYLQERHAHVSTADENLIDSGVFGIPVDFTKINMNMTNAVSKYRTLLADRPELVNVPLVVAFFFDPFADHFDLYPRKMEFPEVSGILKVEKDHLIRAVAEKMSLEQLEDRIASGSMAGLPPNTKAFRLVENESAKLKLPRHFVEWCIT